MLFLKFNSAIQAFSLPKLKNMPDRIVKRQQMYSI